MNSMTGFGRAEEEIGGQKINVEIKSVNHRFLDINIKMPRFMLFLEEEVRKAVKANLVRGRVDVFINYAVTGESDKSVRVDIPLIKAYMQAVAQIEQECGIENDMTMSSVVRIPDAISFDEAEKDEGELKTLLMETLDKAIQELKTARAKEGVQISGDIFMRLGLLEETVAKIEKKEPLVVEEYKEKLKNRLLEALEDTDIDENRFNAEIVYFADKCSITEEIIRLKSHIKHCGEALSGEAAGGRNMDFIIQEMNRELNTIGSKSQDIEITNLVLFGKGEVEKIREQVQNIE